MAQEPQKSNTVLIIIAVIGVVGTICAATIGAFTTYNVEKLRQESELTRIALVSIATQSGATQVSLVNTVSAPTNTPLPTYAPLATLTPYPTYTLVPTATEEPYKYRLCPIEIKQADIVSFNVGIVAPEIIDSLVIQFDAARVQDAGAFPSGTRIPAGVIVATNFDTQDASKWAQYPVTPLARSGSYGIFETIGEYIAPNAGACRVMVP